MMARTVFINEDTEYLSQSFYSEKMTETSYAVEKILSGKQMRLFSQLNNNIRGNFYDIHFFMEWPQFTTIEELLQNNRETMKRIDEILVEIKHTL